MKEELLRWTDGILTKIGSRNPMANLVIPFVKNGINNKIDDIVNMIDQYSIFFTDKDGKLNQHMFDDFMTNFSQLEKTEHTMFGMEMIIGKGEIELLPNNAILNALLQSGIKFTKDDIIYLKDLLWNHFSTK